MKKQDDDALLKNGFIIDDFRLFFIFSIIIIISLFATCKCVDDEGGEVNKKS